MIFLSIGLLPGKKEHAILPTQRLKLIISGSRSVKQLPAKAIA
jgi:hypothetical protein